MTLTISKVFLVIAVILLVAAALGGHVQHVSLVLLAAAFFVAAQLGL
jgi:hypothetical protein